MKKNILKVSFRPLFLVVAALFATLMMSSFLSAQQRGGKILRGVFAAKMAQQQASENLAEYLSLTAEQREKIKKITNIRRKKAGSKIQQRMRRSGIRQQRGMRQHMRRGGMRQHHGREQRAWGMQRQRAGKRMMQRAHNPFPFFGLQAGEVVALLTPQQIEKFKALKESTKKGEVPVDFIEIGVNRMAKNLNLTAQQQEKIKDAQVEMWKGRHEIASTTKNPRAKLQKMRKLRRSTKKKSMEVLTEAQRETLKTRMKKEMKEARKGMVVRQKRMQRGRNFKVKMKLLSKELVLTEEQQKQVGAILKSSIGERRENRGQGGQREGAAEMRTEINEKIRAILTPEQQKKFDEIQKNRQSRRQRGGMVRL